MSVGHTSRNNRCRSGIFTLGLVSVFAFLIGCSPGTTDEFSGQSLFASHCSACHGVRGEGDGPVAGVMEINVPNLRSLSERNNGSFPTDSIARFVDGRELPQSHGDKYMPIWGDVFSWPIVGQENTEQRVQGRINAVVEFVRELQYPSR